MKKKKTMKNQSMMKKKKQSKKVLSRNSRPRHTNKKSRRASSSQARTTKIDDSNRTRRSSSGSSGYSDNTFRNPTTGRNSKDNRPGRSNNSNLRPSSASNPSSLRQRQYIRHFLTSAICLVVVVGIALLIWALTGKPDVEEIQDTFSNFNFQDFFNSDPFAGKNRNGPQPKWEVLPDNQNNGKLRLEIWNALDDDWQRIFNVVVKEWNSGSPDTLDLITKRVDVDDPNCEPQIGVMKVCNNNYGDTGWLGLNEIIIDQTTNHILSSVAKMNEYYLQNAEYDVRQYTMCHEIGHGFGLYHTDENFDNPDLGNCLDYTSKPSNNLHPGQINFQALQDLYFGNDDEEDNEGGVRTRRLLLRQRRRYLR